MKPFFSITIIFRSLIPILFLAIFCFYSCAPSPRAIQTAIAQTQAALPSSTDMAFPTASPYLVIVPSLPATQIQHALPSPTSDTSRMDTTLAVIASPTVNPSPLVQGAISWQKADDFIGKLVTVCGPVMGSHFAKSSNGQPTFLNLGKDYPDPERFAVLIWGSDRDRFPGPPEAYYLGKTICVTGMVSSFQGLIEMEIKDPDQIAIQ